MTIVPRPRVISVKRRRAGSVSAGDVARVQMKPGLMALLQPLFDCGFQARYSLPVGLASTAALAVLQPVSQGIDWVGRDLDIEWLGAPSLDDTLLVEARVEQFSERRSRFSIAARTQTGSPIYEGSLRLVGMRDHRPCGFRSKEEYDAVRFSLQAAKSAPTEAAGLLRLIEAPSSIPLGRSAVVEVEIRNTADRSLQVTVEAQPPFGAGLSLDGVRVHNLTLDAGERCRTGWTVRADRPHEVNLGKPWPFGISAGGETLSVPIAVPDPKPGRTFYLLTEDCETFDGGSLTGSYSGMESFGNHNNFMDPEDYRIQMIHKPNRLNQIAERHGAHWTHFYAVTQRFGAEWAAQQSDTGQWTQIISEMDASIRAGAAEHEYAPHIHFDYEPESKLPPQPRLVYDRETDGILPNDYYDAAHNPNHRYHDWDGAARGNSGVRALGDWASLDTKTGSLRKSVRHLARLSAHCRSGVVGRTGSHDFGGTAEDQAVSTQAYIANGLFGNSDDYDPGAPTPPGGQMYWCSEQNRKEPIRVLRDARLVQLKITKDTTFTSAADMNDWFHASRDACRGPGVHSILFTSHAMFCGGKPDRFRSLEGGAFDEFDAHLGWVRANYPDVEFATASEAVIEFLDYYSPILQAHTETLVRGGDPSTGRYEFAVRLLGQGIRVDEEHPVTVHIAAPACFSPDELTELSLTQEGKVIAATHSFDKTRQPVLNAVLNSRAPLLLSLQLRPEAIETALAWFWDQGQVMFHDPPEALWPDLFHLYPPQFQGEQIRFSTSFVRLLMNPVAGHSEPLGRRVHPLGGFAAGVALTAAFHATGHSVPVHLKLRWLNTLDLECDFAVNTQVTARGVVFQIRDDSGRDLVTGEVLTQSGAAEALCVGSPPPPCVNSLHPETVVAGESFQVHDDRSTIAVLGVNFDSGATVLFDGHALPTTFGSAGFLSAALHENLFSKPGLAMVRVRNADGQDSNEVLLPIVDSLEAAI